MEKIAKLEADFDRQQDPKLVKEMLIGSWKLLVTDGADKLATTGLAGFADKAWTTVPGHWQTFKKPDPMAIFSGEADKSFMETAEVVHNSKDGTSSLAILKGGFQVSDFAAVVEYYTRREYEGHVETGLDPMPNSWVCTLVTPTLRVCTLADTGIKRVYAKVDEEAMALDMARLNTQDVAVDPEAVAAYEEELAAAAAAAEESDDDEDDPNDNRPLWQKRIDKADGVKRTKNGTPIINHGPIGGGGGPPADRG